MIWDSGRGGGVGNKEVILYQVFILYPDLASFVHPQIIHRDVQGATIYSCRNKPMSNLFHGKRWVWCLLNTKLKLLKVYINF